MGVGFALIPVYFHYLGSEAYGLIGFFALLQTWFQFLDMGMAATLARETARFRAGAVSAEELRHLFVALQRIFIVVAVVVAFAIVALSGWVVTRWLTVQAMPTMVAAQAVMLMGLILPIRWIAGLYSNLIYGFERQTWLSGFSILATTLRSGLVIVLFVYVSTSVLALFWLLLAMALVELAVVAGAAYRQLPRALGAEQPRTWWSPLRKVASLSLLMSFSTIVWMLATQVDKVLLSSTLSLGAYGHFAVTMALAGAVTALAAPIGLAIQPRLARLMAEGAHEDAVGLYRRATQVLCVVVAPATFTLAFFAEHVLRAWTGDEALAVAMAPVLTLYASGNGVLALAALPYFLQYGYGKLRLHAAGTTLLAAGLVPAMIAVVPSEGALGAGAVWLLGMAMYLLLWIPMAHRACAPGLHWRWLLHDVLRVMAPGALAAYALSHWVTWPAGRIGIALTAVVVFFVIGVCCCAAAPSTRQLVAESVRALTKRLTAMHQRL